MVNYDKSKVYKLCCKDPTVEDVYIGSTTNFHRRKQTHKCRCTNEHDSGYMFPVYRFIREHGGWDNWDMVLVKRYSLKDKQALRRKERKHMEKYKATLNVKVPAKTQKEWIEENRDKVNGYKRKYYKKNKAYLMKKSKQHYEENREKILVQNQNRQVTCDCGSVINKYKLARHKKSMKHQRWANDN
jgi:hypothetical protein